MVTNRDNGLRLNLGSGFTRYQGFTNIDMRKTPHVIDTNVMDFRKLQRYKDESVDEILSRHSFEHVPYYECEDVLKEWCRVLKPGSKCHIVMPDFQLLSAAWYRGELTHDVFMHNLYGEIDGEFFKDPQDWHKSMWDYNSLLALAKKCGFSTIRVVKLGEKKFYDENINDFVDLPHGIGIDTHFELVK